MFTFYHNVETIDGSHSTSCGPDNALEVAKQLHAETGKAIIVEIVLEKNGQVFYEDDKSVSETIMVISVETVVPALHKQVLDIASDVWTTVGTNADNDIPQDADWIQQQMLTIRNLLSE